MTTDGIIISDSSVANEEDTYKNQCCQHQKEQAEAV